MRRIRFEVKELGGLLVLAVLILLAWWFLTALLSVTLGQLLVLAAVGFVGFWLGRSTRR
jgi:branched-subunit amino acid transport protein AzlD